MQSPPSSQLGPIQTAASNANQSNPQIAQTATGAGGPSPAVMQIERERLADHLAQEIRSWIVSIELSDRQRQRVIKLAGLLLDASPLKANGESPFDKNRALSELLDIWMPKTRNGNRDCETSLARWLASWIRFWIAGPIIWKRALDIALAHFGAQDQAA
jgi:hypothetical protein